MKYFLVLIFNMVLEQIFISIVILLTDTNFIGILDITLFSVCVVIFFITTVIISIITKPVLHKIVNITDSKKFVYESECF